MKTRIVALDPGGTTGVAKAVIADEAISDIDQSMLGPFPHHAALWSLLHEAGEGVDRLIIVCESFEYRNRPRTGLDLISKEYIGVVNLFVATSELPSVKSIFQSASMGKIRAEKTEGSALVKRGNLKQLGLWTLGPNGERHMVDATGHLVYYLLTSRGVISKEERLQLMERGGWK